MYCALAGFLTAGQPAASCVAADIIVGQIDGAEALLSMCTAWLMVLQYTAATAPITPATLPGYSSCKQVQDLGSYMSLHQRPAWDGSCGTVCWTHTHTRSCLNHSQVAVLHIQQAVMDQGAAAACAALCSAPERGASGTANKYQGALPVLYTLCCRLPICCAFSFAADLPLSSIHWHAIVPIRHVRNLIRSIKRSSSLARMMDVYTPPLYIALVPSRMCCEICSAATLSLAFI